ASSISSRSSRSRMSWPARSPKGARSWPRRTTRRRPAPRWVTSSPDCLTVCVPVPDKIAAMGKVLVTEEIAEGGLDRLRQAGHDVDIRLGLSPDALLEAVRSAHALIVRSATKVTAPVLD